MSEVVNLDDHRPHAAMIVQTADGKDEIRVIPCAFFEDYLAGKRTIDDLEEWRPVVREIVRFWYATHTMEDG